MSLALLFLLVGAVAAYWIITQVLPQRRHETVVRPGLARGLIGSLNEQRRQRGLSALTEDGDLAKVAEAKAAHQLRTAISEEGWDYPAHLREILGRSLLMETVITAPLPDMGERMRRQRDLFDSEWTRCGMGVAVGQSSAVVVALILSREAWATPEDDAARPSGRLLGMKDRLLS